ncbi:MAG TPA: hypothetical protein DCP69_04225 [Candidatus Omnitrophica bacterium]|nr:hypothetical protein [Candidatus Omnitrophota bacterium]
MIEPRYQSDRVTLYCADCLDVMAGMEPNSVDSIITDPPYGLAFMGVGWDTFATRKGDNGHDPTITFDRLGGNHHPEDSADRARTHAVENTKMQDWHYRWAGAALRVAKPGAMLMAFGGTRTFHRLACAIEDAGWEIRDTMMYCYGSGFPKSRRLNQSPMFCQCGEAGRNGDCTIHEPSQSDHIDMPDLSVGDGPLAPSAPRLTSAGLGSQDDYLLAADCHGERAPLEQGVAQASLPLPGCAQERSHSCEHEDGQGDAPSHSPCQAQCNDRPSSQDCSHPDHSSPATPGSMVSSKSPADTCESDSHTQDTNQGLSSCTSGKDYSMGFPSCQVCGKPIIDGWGTALKPAWEPIIVAMKPLDGTFAQNAQKWGVAGLWIDGARVGTATDKQNARVAKSKLGKIPQATWNADTCGYIGNGEGWNGNIGRWPANLIHDGSDEVVSLFPQSKGQQASIEGDEPSHTGGEGATCYGEFGRVPFTKRGDSGSAARFFYCAKASKSERDMGLDGEERPIVFWQTANGTSGKPSSISEGRNTARRNHHPTVKPLSLMRYLCRLTKTPTGGVVLDPFMGSGTTGCAAIMEGRDFIGIEKEPEYLAIAERRIRDAEAQLHLPGVM